MKDPKLYLGIDNCFACKRWVRPSDWMLLVKDLGITYVEQSADTECDPLYMGPEYMKEWIRLVQRGSEKTGVYVKSVFSGHGTYSTCGLAHWHDSVRVRFREEWMKPQADTARALGAGLGFFAHAIEHRALQSRFAYEEALSRLRSDLADLAAYAQRIGLPFIALEQMYTPHMPPWTIRGTKDMLQNVMAQAHSPLYVTLDIGHMNGQQYFLRPVPSAIEECIKKAAAGENVKRPWIGTDRANALYEQEIRCPKDIKGAVEKIVEEIRENPHLFALPGDGDIWQWVKELGRYAPIIHLQQTDGKSSPHWPFSAAYNQKGVASGEKLMESLVFSFMCEETDAKMPEPVDEIVLILEPFMGTAANPYQSVDEIAESVQYWRRFIPYDGIRLSEAYALSV